MHSGLETKVAALKVKKLLKYWGLNVPAREQSLEENCDMTQL